ncbi:hypothetical protein Maes01_02760 [Microbulbifer aestuariivivens]|uniref:Uncharacterized protein n=1 Tax=Microbulbifer aestuariivivens TaxID=1908308 RepID=A0ABP9WVL1_9GAMM
MRFFGISTRYRANFNRFTPVKTTFFFELYFVYKTFIKYNMSSLLLSICSKINLNHRIFKLITMHSMFLIFMVKTNCIHPTTMHSLHKKRLTQLATNLVSLFIT